MKPKFTKTIEQFYKDKAKLIDDRLIVVIDNIKYEVLINIQGLFNYYEVANNE